MVVRAALYVSPFTAQIKTVSDEIPHILQGIPLDVRSITLKMNRPEFTLNPTNCEELGFSGSALSTLSSSASLTQRFQVGGCQSLGFLTKLSLKLNGGTQRSGNPSLTATLTMPKPGVKKFRCRRHGKRRHCRVAIPQQANIAAAQVTLPSSAYLEQGHMEQICRRPPLEAYPARSPRSTATPGRSRRCSKSPSKAPSTSPPASATSSPPSPPS